MVVTVDIQEELERGGSACSLGYASGAGGNGANGYVVAY
jgi:hypothetical protein